MKPNLNNPHGYKICYREKGSKDFIKRFITRTYREAKSAKEMYLRYPSLAALYKQPLKKLEWVIIPIKKSEVRDGIWHEVPFWKQEELFYINTENRR